MSPHPLDSTTTINYAHDMEETMSTETIETIAAETDVRLSAYDYGNFRVVSLSQGRAGFYAYKSASTGSTIRDLNLYDVISVTTTAGVNGGTIIAFTHADGSTTNVHHEGPQQ